MGRKPWSGIGLIILTIHMLQVSCTETKTETKTVICTESIFLESADSGDTVALKQCLTSGIDIDLVNDSSLTALILAARQNRARCVKLLLDAGANSHYMNRRDIHAVGLAKGRGHQEVIDVIFRHQRSE